LRQEGRLGQCAGMSPDAKLQSFVFRGVIESKIWHLVQRHQLPLDRAAQPLCLVVGLVVSELATDPRRIELQVLGEVEGLLKRQGAGGRRGRRELSQPIL
jgi:hypothetical protein